MRRPPGASGRPFAAEFLGPEVVCGPGPQLPEAAAAPAAELQPTTLKRTKIMLNRKTIE